MQDVDFVIIVNEDELLDSVIIMPGDDLLSLFLEFIYAFTVAYALLPVLLVFIIREVVECAI